MEPETKKGSGIFKKIDRIMGNSKFIDEFPSSCALFQPYGLSDHLPCVLKLPIQIYLKHPPFKFANILVHKSDF